jgi:hypothetical protein
MGERRYTFRDLAGAVLVAVVIASLVGWNRGSEDALAKADRREAHVWADGACRGSAAAVQYLADSVLGPAAPDTWPEAADALAIQATKAGVKDVSELDIEQSWYKAVPYSLVHEYGDYQSNEQFVRIIGSLGVPSVTVTQWEDSPDRVMGEMCGAYALPPAGAA